MDGKENFSRKVEPSSTFLQRRGMRQEEKQSFFFLPLPATLPTAAEIESAQNLF